MSYINPQILVDLASQTQRIILNLPPGALPISLIVCDGEDRAGYIALAPGANAFVELTICKIADEISSGTISQQTTIFTK